MAKKPTIKNITAGYASNTTLNENFQALRDAFEGFLSLDGESPNAMNADLDLNGNNLLNVNGLFINGANLLALINNITISTLSPSGGQDGDIWFTVST